MIRTPNGHHPRSRSWSVTRTIATAVIVGTPVLLFAQFLNGFTVATLFGDLPTEAEVARATVLNLIECTPWTALIGLGTVLAFRRGYPRSRWSWLGGLTVAVAWTALSTISFAMTKTA